MQWQRKNGRPSAHGCQAVCRAESLQDAWNAALAANQGLQAAQAGTALAWVARLVADLAPKRGPRGSISWCFGSENGLGSL